MKQTLIIALMAPCAAFAQSTKKSNPATPAVTVAFSEMHLREDCLAVDRNNAGTWTLRNQKQFVTTPDDKSPRKIAHHDIMMAENVTLSNNGKQTLSADHFNYDADDMKATLTGNVTVSNDGTDKKLGSYAVVDLSDNRCRIELLR